MSGQRLYRNNQKSEDRPAWVSPFSTLTPQDAYKGISARSETAVRTQSEKPKYIPQKVPMH